MHVAFLSLFLESVKSFYRGKVQTYTFITGLLSCLLAHHYRSKLTVISNQDQLKREFLNVTVYSKTRRIQCFGRILEIKSSKR